MYLNPEILKIYTSACQRRFFDQKKIMFFCSFCLIFSNYTRPTINKWEIPCFNMIFKQWHLILKFIFLDSQQKKKKTEKSAFLIRFDVKYEYSDSFPFQIFFSIYITVLVLKISRLTPTLTGSCKILTTSFCYISNILKKIINPLTSPNGCWYGVWITNKTKINGLLA